MQAEEKYMNSKSSKSNEKTTTTTITIRTTRTTEAKTSTVYFFRCPPQEDSPAWIKYFIASWDKALFLANIEIFQVAG